METNPLLGMLNQWTIAAITMSPFVFQYVKALVLKFGPEGADLSKQVSAVLNMASIVGVIVWQGVTTGADITTIATQSLIGLIVAEIIYKQAVERMANSSNPLVPQTATDKEAKAELGT